MKPNLHAHVVIVFAAVALASCASTATGERAVEQEVGASTKDDLVDEVLKLSGVTAHVQRLPGTLLDQSDVMAEQVGIQGYGEIREGIQKSFKPAALYGSLAEHLRRHADRERLMRARDFLRSNAARRMVKLETDAMAPANTVQVERYLEELTQRPPSAELVAQVDGLDEAMGTTQRMLDVVFSYLRVMVALSSEDGVSLPDDYVIDEERQLRMGIYSQLKQETLAQLLYAYRDVDDQDLAAYTAFWSSEDGAWLARMLRSGMVQAIRDAGIDAVETVAEERDGPAATS